MYFDYRQMGYPYPPYGTYGQMGMPQTGMYPGMAQQPSGVTVPVPSGATIPLTGVPGAPIAPGAEPTTAEESYIENILRFNRGKIGTFYYTYENNREWNAKVYRGRVETAGRDHIIISDPQTGKRYLLLMVNLDWVEFDEPLVYIAPGATAAPLTTGADVPTREKK